MTVRISGPQAGGRLRRSVRLRLRSLRPGMQNVDASRSWHSAQQDGGAQGVTYRHLEGTPIGSSRYLTTNAMPEEPSRHDHGT